MRKLVLFTVALGALVLAPSASAAIPNVFTGTATPVACAVDVDGVRECGNTSPRSTVPTPVDNVPIDVNVALPPEPVVGPDGNFPLIIWGHGYGGSKISFNAMRRFTDRGYAVFAMTTRGFHESCGSADSRTAGGAICDDEGYVRLMDTRYEVRDAQEFAGLLHDEGVIDGQRVGAVGGSYGGGLSMALGALRNRKMLTDGSLVPWTSPGGDPMRVAGAVPSIPWTDLAYSLLPNGSTLDYVADAPYRGRFGVMKQSLVTGLYVSGQGAPGYYVTAGGDPDADLTTWYTMINAGEPYDGNPLAGDILDEVTTHHSSYYIDHSQPPAPLLISSGFTDDLFPADEAVRFYNRTRTQFPGAAISLYFGNFGHQRGANKAADGADLTARENTWLDFYVKGTGPTPSLGVITRSQTCPNSAPSGGPFGSSNWATATLGEVRLEQPAALTAVAGAGSTVISGAFNPVTAGNNPCGVQSGADQGGVATYRLPTVTGSGYTLNGSPTVIADVTSGAANSQLAMRLLDVGPDGTETLVARGALRPNAGTTPQQVFQLHPNAWHFAAGHTPKLELLARDGRSGGTPLDSYLRVSNGQGNVTMANLQLRLPVLQRPGANGGMVKAPRPKVVPAGYTLAKDFADLPTGRNATLPDGRLVAKGGKVEVPVASPDTWEACHAQVEIAAGGTGATTAAKGKKKKKKKGKRGEYVVASKNATRVAIPGGQTGKVVLTLTKKGRKALKKRKRKGKALTVTVRLTTAEQDGTVTATRKLTLKKGKKKGKKRGKKRR
jgi:hypothetical protein